MPRPRPRLPRLRLPWTFEPRGETADRGAPATRRSRARTGGTLAAVLLLGTAVAGGWLVTRDDTSQAAARTTTATVAAGTVQQTVSVSGTLAAARTATDEFAVSGTVTHVYVGEGDTVEQGAALARVDAGTLRATRTAAAAALDAAQAQLEDDEDDGASDVQLAADESAVLSARADLADAREAVRDATLRASIAGRVVGMDLEVGDVVGGGGSGQSSDASSSGSGGTGGSTTSDSTSDSGNDSTAVEIVAPGRYVLEATVAATDAEQVVDGLQAELTVSGVDDTVYGTVSDVGLVAETSTSGAAVFPVTITVTGTRDDLYAGTSADASIVVEQRDGVLTVPSAALTSEDGATYVDLLADGSDGETTRTEVEVGETYGSSTEVVSGLEEGDEVEIAGFSAPGGEMSGGGGGGEEGGFPGGGDMGGGMQPPGGDR